MSSYDLWRQQEVATSNTATARAASTSNDTDRFDPDASTGPDVDASGYTPVDNDFGQYNPLSNVLFEDASGQTVLNVGADPFAQYQELDVSAEDYYLNGLYFDYAKDNRSEAGRFANRFGQQQPQTPSGFNNGRFTFSDFGNPAPVSTLGQGLDYYWQGVSAQERVQLNQLIGAAYAMKDTDYANPLNSSFASKWEDALRQSIASGIPVMELLRNAARANIEAGYGSGSGSGAAGPKRPTVRVISEEDAEELINSTAVSELGRKLSDDERKVMKQITKSIQTKMASEQNAMIDQQMAGGGQVEDPTSTNVLAKNEVEENFETEAGAYDIADQFAQMVRFLGRPGGM